MFWLLIFIVCHKNQCHPYSDKWETKEECIRYADAIRRQHSGSKPICVPSTDAIQMEKIK
jgi:hypothetical protein